MKRPRIALCLLMALLATSLYAVGFAADRENAALGATEEADMCEYAYEGYCEHAYDRPVAAYSHDSCNIDDERLDSYDDYAAEDDDSYDSYSSYDNYAADDEDSPESYERYAADDEDSLDSYDDYTAADHTVEDDDYSQSYDSYVAGDDDSQDSYEEDAADAYAVEDDSLDACECYVAGDDELSADSCQSESVDAELEALSSDEYEAEAFVDDYDFDDSDYVGRYAPQSSYDEDRYSYDDYSEELAENAEPQAADAGTWCGRYCLSRDYELSQSLPAGAIRRLVERVNDSLVQLLHDPCGEMDFAADWQAAADEEASESMLPPAASLGCWLDGRGWSVANGASAHHVVIADPLSRASESLPLVGGDSQPVKLRALVRPLARLVVDLRNGWTQAWSELSELASEPDEVPAVTSRPEAPAANPAGDPGRDTRTSLRRNPRRVEI